jgi:hypothetical protein
MEDVVHAFAGALERVEVQQINLAEINLARNLVEIRPLASRKIVDAADFIALGEYGASER